MSETNTDLGKLVLDRSQSTPSANLRRHRRWVSRYALPAGILIGFITLLVAATGLQFVPAKVVTVVPVLVQRGEIQNSGAPLFQAAGWIEPRPTSISVPALAPGVIEDLLVVEGQEVEKGQPIARLVSIDAEIAVEKAHASYSLSDGELKRAQAELAAAVARRDNPLHLKVPLAEARSLLARAMTEKEKLPFLIKAAEAQAQFSRLSAEAKQNAKDAVPGMVVLQAERDHVAARAELEELQARGPNLTREIIALQEKTQALEGQLALLIEEQRQVAEAEAKLASAKAVCDQSRLRIREAELTRQRMRICAPMHGRVLRLVAAPGNRVMGLEHNAGQSSSTVVEMYDPSRLQVRADVRLEDVPMVTPGAPVEITTASSSYTIQGRVLQPTSTANIQKNTLEVKVALIDPPSTVRPEMLVTATFLTQVSGSKTEAAPQADRVFIPRQLVSGDQVNSIVWIVDENNHAAPRPVTLGEEGSDGLVEVTDGIQVTDKLIASGTGGLKAGETVVIQEEDQTIGVGR